MATYSKAKLSGSTNGKQIKVVAVASAGTLIHTAVAGEVDWDEVYIWAVNSQAASVKLTIEWGEAAAPDGNIEVNIPGESGLFLVIPGLIIQNSLEIRAFASAANVVMLSGFVNRITA
jgi:hypothetical protein